MTSSPVDVSRSIWDNRYKEQHDVLIAVYRVEDVHFENCTIQNNKFNNINYHSTSANKTIPCIYVRNSGFVNIQFNTYSTTEEKKYALHLIGNIDNLIYSSTDKKMLVYITDAILITNSKIATQQGITGNFNSSIIDKSTHIMQYGNNDKKGTYYYKFHN